VTVYHGDTFLSLAGASTLLAVLDLFDVGPVVSFWV
jgi:hypothetical protein